jgi:serine/threonine-protein kinase
MESKRWRRIQELLDALFDLTPQERKTRMDALSGEDAELRPDLERLLDAEDENRTGVLDRGVGPLVNHVIEAPDPPTTPPGTRIGPFRIVRDLGPGGMGEVLLAERVEGDFEQRVALKIVRRSPDRTEMIERFRRERRILARLRHPNIAALFEGGTTADGVPYFAMEYVEGERITDWCDARRLGVDARIGLFESVCRAVEYAHRNLIVHRDIKPGNVFVTADGNVKLLDFGISKILDADDPDRTQAARAFLTPAFASPEQIRGEAASTLSDVFSLGTLLYVLLTGRHPHGDTSRSVQVARAIAEDDPPEPSRVVREDTGDVPAAKRARLRASGPAELERQLRGDLDNIVVKALSKNPEERYSSAQALREDLERYRKLLPVEARRPTARYRMRKFVRRHLVATASTITVLLAVMTGIGGILWQARVAARERDRARAVKDYLVEIFSAGNPAYESGEALTAVELLERGADRISTRFHGRPEIRAEITLVLGNALTGLAQYARAETVLVEALEEQRRVEDPAGLHEALLGLGDCVLALGQHDRALTLYREAEELAGDEFGAGSPRTLLASRKVAGGLQALGRLDEAETRYREVLHAAERRFDREPHRIAPFHEGLAGLLTERGDLEGAERQQRAAVAAYRKDGVGGVPFSVALGSLGGMLVALDRKEEAEEMLRESVAELRKEYGEEGHPNLADAMTELAGTLMQWSVSEPSGRERLEEADRLLAEAVELLERDLGPDHWRVGQAYSNQSVVKTKLGDIEAAGGLLSRSVDIIRASLGNRHPTVAAPLSNLARNFLRQKRHAEAESVYVEAIAVARECFGDSSVFVSHPVFGLADLCFETGRYGEAETAAREAWRLRDAALGPGNSIVVENRVRIAEIQAAAGRRAEALATLDGAVADARGGLPETAVVLATALLERAGQGREAGEPRAVIEPLLREALKIRRERLGDEDERTVAARDALARVRAGES